MRTALQEFYGVSFVVHLNFNRESASFLNRTASDFFSSPLQLPSIEEFAFWNYFLGICHFLYYYFFKIM